MRKLATRLSLVLQVLGNPEGCSRYDVGMALRTKIPSSYDAGYAEGYQRAKKDMSYELN